MTRTETKAGLCAMVFGLTMLLAGCSRQGDSMSPVQRSDVASQTELTGNAEPNPEIIPSQPETTVPILTPAHMGFPPGYAAPWSMKVSPEPLSPARSANTGDYRGTWPDYRCPREMIITAPELPPGIDGPTSEAMTDSSPGNS